MADYSLKQVGRAAAILTTGEVAGATFKLSRAKDRKVTVALTFTIGSLTDVDVHFYGSVDGTNWDVIAPNGAAMTETLTASAERMYPVPSMEGVKFFRVSVQGGGTVTSSSCAFDYLYTRPGGY